MGCENTGFLPATDAKKLSVEWSLIYKEICAIQQAILGAIDGHAFETTVNGNSPWTSLQGIHSVEVLAGGSGYTELTIDETNVSVISTAPSEVAVLPPIMDPVTGAVIGFVIPPVGTGIGYGVGDQVVITSTHGTGFIGEVGTTVPGGQGNIESIAITDGGLGYYSSGGYVEATDPMGTGTGATFTLNLSECGTISSVDVVTSGSSYSQATTLAVISPTGTGAIVIPKIYATTANVHKYWAVWAEQLSDRQIQYQLEYVTKYFQDLGYQIQIQTNPATENTIQWFISW